MAIVKFGDVATRVNTKEDRHNTDLVYYVGGDHIDSNALKVSKRGVIKGAPLGPMFYFGFKPGDILFVTRNPHLRKSAMVDFSGICSEKTLVIATKDENVLCQKYLAGVMQSDDFWDFLEENKSGSVNYFINWSTLAEYEFDLPPIEEQRALAEKLWAANDLREKYQNLLVATDDMLKAKFREMFGECGGQSAECGVISDLTEGSVESASAKYGPNDEFSYIDISSVGGTFEGIGICEKFKRNRSPSRAQQCVKRGDILVSMVRPNLRKMAVVDFDDDNYVASTGFCVIRPRQGMLQYLKGVVSSEAFTAAMMAEAKGTNYPAVNNRHIMDYPILIPTAERAQEFGKILQQAETSKAELKKSTASIDAVMKGLING